MKLLLDENISFKLVKKLSNDFPDIIHVKSLQLTSINDTVIFNYAKNNNLAIVTFDEDYFTLSVLNGFPPKVIWLRTGNISTRNVEALLKSKRNTVTSFLNDNSVDAYGCLEIYGE
ncbi:MAG: DUF5615 family PIN-like protein [Chitinophagaceae bacterium]